MRTLKVLLAIFLLIDFGCSRRPQTDFKVEISRNMETLTVLYLASDIGLQAHEGSLSLEAKQHFDQYKDHQVIDLFKRIIERTGSFDSPVDLILRLSELPGAEIAVPLDTGFVNAVIGNRSVKKQDNLIHQFIVSLNDFYREAGVQQFIRDHKSYYAQCRKEVVSSFPGDEIITAMEEYYGKTYLSYNLIPSPMLFPGVGFGKRVERSAGTDVYYIFGPVTKQESPEHYTWGFDSSIEIKQFGVHEFGHSFVNPVTESSENRALIDRYAYLYDPIANYMRNQGYNTWWICVTEHLVRLGEIRIACAINDNSWAEEIRSEYINSKKFMYLPYLEQNILEYENNRDTYETFRAFAPVLIEKTFSAIDTAKLEL